VKSYCTFFVTLGVVKSHVMPYVIIHSNWSNSTK